MLLLSSQPGRQKKKSEINHETIQIPSQGGKVLSNYCLMFLKTSAVAEIARCIKTVNSMRLKSANKAKVSFRNHSLKFIIYKQHLQTNLLICLLWPFIKIRN